MTLGFSLKDWLNWKSKSVPDISKEDMGKMDYDEITGLIKFLTTEYKTDFDVFDDMGWRRHQYVRYQKKLYEVHNLPPITHEELKKWDKIERKYRIHDISKQTAMTITGVESMNIFGLVDGMPAAGKSDMLQNLGWGAGLRTADILTGDPANWRKHFNFSKNLRVIDKAGFTELFKDTSIQSIRIGDDAFSALNRTKFMTKYMEDLNTIAATDRVFKCATFFSAQWETQLDIIIRQLAGIRIDCKRRPSARKKELNTFKFHIMTFNPYDRRNMKYNRYVHRPYVDVEDHFCGRPPSEILEFYDLYRDLSAVMLKKKPLEEQVADELGIDDPYVCPICQVRDIYTDKNKVTRCKICGFLWKVHINPVDGSTRPEWISPLPDFVRRRLERAEAAAARAAEES